MGKYNCRWWGIIVDVHHCAQHDVMCRSAAGTAHVFHEAALLEVVAGGR